MILISDGVDENPFARYQSTVVISVITWALSNCPKKEIGSSCQPFQLFLKKTSDFDRFQGLMFQLKAEISNHPRVVSQQVHLLSPFSLCIGRLYLIQLSLIVMMMMIMINDQYENDFLLCVTRFCSLKKVIVTIKTIYISLPP